MNGDREDVCEMCGYTGHAEDCPRRIAFAECPHADVVEIGHCTELGAGHMWSCNDCDALAPCFYEDAPPLKWFDDWDAAVHWFWAELDRGRGGA